MDYEKNDNAELKREIAISIDTAREHIRHKMDLGDNWIDSYINVLSPIRAYLEMLNEKERTGILDKLTLEVRKEQKIIGHETVPPKEMQDRLIAFLEKFRV